MLNKVSKSIATCILCAKINFCKHNYAPKLIFIWQLDTPACIPPKVGLLPANDEVVPTNQWGDVDPSYWEEVVLPLLQKRVHGWVRLTSLHYNLSSQVWPPRSDGKLPRGLRPQLLRWQSNRWPPDLSPTSAPSRPSPHPGARHDGLWLRWQWGPDGAGCGQSHHRAPVRISCLACLVLLLSDLFKRTYVRKFPCVSSTQILKLSENVTFLAISCPLCSNGPSVFIVNHMRVWSNLE